MSSDIAGKLKALKMGVSRRGSSLNATLEAKDIRLQLDEAFERENGYSFDYVLVFQVHDEAAELTKEQKKFSMRTILQHLARGGIETKMFYSADRGHVFCKLRVTLERLSKEADRIDYKVEFDPTELRKIAESGYEDQNIKKIFIKDEYKITPRDPFQNIFAKFDVEPRLQPAYRKYGHKQIPFRGVDRIKLLLNIIKAHGEGGCGLNLSELLKDKCLVAAFPLHDREELDKLKSKWFSWKFAPWSQPLWEIKDYFGEKVGLYFAWLGHYTTWLIAPAIIGSVLFANVIAEGTADSIMVPYFGIFMALWSIFYYEYWKRYNSTLALEWGMSTFEEEEVERPEFQGKETISPIDGSPIRYFSPQKRFRRIMRSLFFISALILLVVGVVAGIFVFRIAATSGKWKDMFTVNGVQLGGPAASTVNAIQIMRATFIVDKIVNLIADDDDEEMAKGNQVRVDLTVFDEDI
ncbi:Anoctamin-3 [Phytophthora boehmeriae]|uniref:Anoctamin-3 n=1 Tax=Phytophthora boehmeriae TaxID=109152 RepID=A0A8T1WXN6_9STRA|nr:Anoctamin-3 [Phytophthora boehmeriae]